ncbi:MAG TPA: hypothetical protein VFK11_03800 [Candidatus Saccharimonadales bacterium]|nr:hypothetical protein [Candidatus Saccharimonadales bacterium]
MTDQSANGGNGDGAEKGPEVSLPKALDAGQERQEFQEGHDAAISGLNDLTAKKTSVETRHERELAQLQACHEIELAELEEERAPLIRDKVRYEGELKSHSGRVSHWKGRLRTLASKPDALRGDQLLYAAFATGGDTSREGLERIAAVDGAVKENHGAVFVVVQDGNMAFGRTRQYNEGLLIDTSKDDEGGVDRVRVPLQPYDVGGGERSPAFGFVSGNFDEIKKDEYTYDPVVDRTGDEDDEIRGAVGLSKTQIEDSHLPLTDPTHIRVLEEFTGEVNAEELLQRGGNEDFILTGNAAGKFLHQFFDSRLAQIGEHDKDAAGKEASRLSVLALKLGIHIDLSKLVKFKAGLFNVDLNEI